MAGRVLRDTEAGYNGWVRWTNDPGVNNTQDAFEGGEPASVPVAIVDLSAAASQLLGKQVQQSQNFRLRRVQVGYRPHDAAVDNESDVAFQGRLEWWAPTDHFKEAMSLARAVERAQEEDQVDQDSLFLSTEQDYSAMRMGWSADDQVVHQTSEGVIGIPGSQWAVSKVQDIYNQMTVPVQNNALFDGRFPSTQSLMWHATLSSGKDNADGAGRLGYSADYIQDGMLHDVGMGLMALTVTHSTPASHQGAVEDDYQWWVAFDFEVMG